MTITQLTQVVPASTIALSRGGVRVTDQIKPIFPTSLMVRHIEGMDAANHALGALIREIEAADRNSAAGTSTKGGFQTADTLLSTHPRANDAALVALKQHIAGAVQD